jgi:hypothetical protein
MRNQGATTVRARNLTTGGVEHTCWDPGAPDYRVKGTRPTTS